MKFILLKHEYNKIIKIKGILYLAPSFSILLPYLEIGSDIGLKW